jgi:oxygen-independent coproporphyrinogen-3 oxidase
MSQANWGLYVHIPFCPQVCPYCSFAVTAPRPRLHQRYAQAVCAEIRRSSHLAARGPLDTVYFGGGTPTLLTPELLGRILREIGDGLGIKADAELTVEANPELADIPRFAALRELGFNRLSLGVQSFGAPSLGRLGRRHTPAQAEAACLAARQAGFENLSLDLIFAIPGAPAEEWARSLERAIALGPEHISTYALTVEEGTPFAKQERHGRLFPVPEEEQAQAYEWGALRLEEAGFEHYEVSNFARPGFRSHHNWGYWHGGQYLGVGLAAHSLMGGRRSWNQRRLQDYLEAVEAWRSPEAGAEELDAASARDEALWLGLRTSEGIALHPALEGRARFRALVEAGYLELRGERVGLTRRGFVLADALGVELMELLQGAEPER